MVSLALFWPYEAAQQRQTMRDAEHVLAGKPASALAAAGREDFYGSDVHLACGQARRVCVTDAGFRGGYGGIAVEGSSAVFAVAVA